MFFFLPFVPGTLFKLFGMYVTKRDMNRAREIYEKCKESNVVATAPFMSTCILFWTLEKNADNALREFDRLRKTYKHFKIDAFKIIDLMTMLIDTDRLSDAHRVLQNARDEVPSQMTYVSMNIWRLLTTASNYSHRHQHSDNLAKEMLEALVKKGFCMHTNKHLSVVIKEYLDKCDIHQAIEHFETFANAHKTTPQILTLLTTLIQLANGNDTNENVTKYHISKEQAIEYIQRVIDVGLGRRSPEWMNTNLLLAFACAGSEDQVRKMLLDPMVDLDAEELKSAVNYLTKRGNIDGILVLIRASRGTQHSALDQKSVCDSLLSHYEVENDFESALKLYEAMRKDDQSNVSKTFATRLKSLLTRNKRNLPQGLLAI